MTDGVGLPKTNLPVPAGEPRHYRAESVREVRARAGAIPQDVTPEERDGLTRLNQILGGGRPLRDDVPRGYYLNIKV